MPTPGKEQKVEEIKAKLKEYDNFIITDYRGLTVEKITELRRKLLEKGVVYQVLKNNLVKIALKDANIEGIDEYLFGPSAIAFAKEDPVFPSKVLVDIAKEGVLKVKGGYSEGKVLNGDEIIELSKLPSKEVLIAMLMGSLLSPATGMVGALSGLARNLVYALDQVAKQKK
ncbi:MAG: 50S ribosomal protein L10 [Spirochaetota bacterium]|nr:50S ribosomal protein L10 [Spirochaetota bacterium]